MPTETGPSSITGANTQKARRRGALSLVEVMISLSICTMLLVAVAAAFSASAGAIENNDRFFRATQAARISMDQMLNAIRRCQTCSVSSSNRLDLITADNADRSYLYLPNSAQLEYVINDSGQPLPPAYPLANNVTALTFTADLEPDPETQIDRVVRVTISLTVTIGDNVITLSSSGVPRRAMVY